MKLSLSFVTFGASVALAAYPGDIVQYWVDQSAILVNGTVIGGLPSPPSGWFEAIVQGSVYLAAVHSQNESLEFQQLAVSHAAHDALLWTFHGTRLYAPIDARFRAVLEPIGLDINSDEGRRARKIGEDAATKVTVARADDGIHHYFDYQPLPTEPGLYQPRPGGPAIPDTPQAQHLRLFGGLGDVKKYRAPPPPAPNSTEFEEFLNQVYEQGGVNSTSRSEYDTETAWYWKESSPMYSNGMCGGWNRLANLVVGDSLATDVLASAKFYAILNYALANAAIASWDTKYFYGAWRPITAIRYPGIYVASGQNFSDSNWEPLLDPTPNHQDYLSTHATFGGAAGAVIRAWNGGDEVDVQLSSNVTDIKQVITRRVTNITQAVVDNGDSRVFGGIHFQYASDVGNKIGDWVGRDTWDAFDKHWDEF